MTATVGSVMGAHVLDPVAVLDARLERCLATRHLLDRLHLPSVGFDRASDLIASLLQGRRFAMLVLAFGEGVASARVELACLRACADPRVPFMVLMMSHQVELSFEIMDSPTSDFLLAPYTDDELQERLGALHRLHGGLALDLGANRTARRSGRRAAQPTGGGTDEESKPMPL